MLRLRTPRLPRGNASRPLHYTRIAEAQKEVKYTTLARALGANFRPFCAESFGAVGEKAAEVLKLLRSFIYCCSIVVVATFFRIASDCDCDPSRQCPRGPDGRLQIPRGRDNTAALRERGLRDAVGRPFPLLLFPLPPLASSPGMRLFCCMVCCAHLSYVRSCMLVFSLCSIAIRCLYRVRG